ncbi:MAG: hypothetical protein JSU63_16660 [Phycisphaerales bacterium]|nr:MAG: hypothetical protein JSU63_16660 [Phycisphaerales bacterium]
MASSGSPMRWDRVARARKLIESGDYDVPWIVQEFLPRCQDDIIADVLACPVGEGHRYRDVAAEAVSRSLGSVVDHALMRKEFSSHGGRGDVELPLRTESISDYPLWSLWCRRFGIKSIIIETKNTRTQATVRDVQQTLAYLVTSRLGHFGLVVSRSGFSRGAKKHLCEIASSDEYLLLPLDHHDLIQFIRASVGGPTRTMEFLRRKETLLLQAA